LTALSEVDLDFLAGDSKITPEIKRIMIEKITQSFQSMSSVQIVENGALFIILVLALVMFCRSSSPFNRYFIPIACILATVLRIVHWAHYGNEPAFISPLVTVVSTWIS